jgi:NitT/TauT family transport system substrate-binding protein
MTVVTRRRDDINAAGRKVRRPFAAKIGSMTHRWAVARSGQRLRVARIANGAVALLASDLLRLRRINRTMRFAMSSELSNFALVRASMTVAAGVLSAAVWSATAFGADKVTFLTSWFAQAEHGGFYQAKATGLYEKAGLDVTIKMGGPQVNGMQLLLAGETDFMMGYDLQVLKMLEQGLPVVTVATSFQFDLQGMMAHEQVTGLDDLKDKTILVATSGRTTWWPWLKAKFNYSEEQTKPYTFNLQPFFADKNVVQQSYPSSEPFQAKQQGVPVKFFLFARDGYPPYGTTMVTTRGFVDKKADATARFVKASLEGWKSYFSDPAPANALIKADNPKMSDEQIAFAIEQLKALKSLDGGDAQTMGIGIITEARWKATYDFMVSAGLLKPEVDWKLGFTDRFVKTLKLSM